MRFKASAARSPFTPAGSSGGPMMTKSLYMTRRRERPCPWLIHSFSAAGEWVRRTSPSPRAPCFRMSPLPATIVFTLKPVLLSKPSMMYLRMPLSWVVVVVSSTSSLLFGLWPNAKLNAPTRTMAKTSAADRREKLSAVCIACCLHITVLHIPLYPMGYTTRRQVSGSDAHNGRNVLPASAPTATSRCVSGVTRLADASQIGDAAAGEEHEYPAGQR